MVEVFTIIGTKKVGMSYVRVVRDIPIIFVQAGGFLNGGSELLMKIALKQAAIACPSNQVILLTDAKRHGLPEITQALLSHYWSWDAFKFKLRYKHWSDNPPQFERFCFLRWYYLRAFLRRHRIDHFCLLDTDILLFSPIQIFAAEFMGYRAGNWTWANIISDIHVIDELIDYFERIFNDNRLRDEISTKYYPGVPPRLTDMVVLL
jgi:hypothetical protein